MRNLVKVAVVAVGIVCAGNAVSAQQKLGHINSSDLLQAMPEMKTADASFQTFAKAKQTALEKMDAERQKKIAVYQEKAKTISESNKEACNSSPSATRCKWLSMYSACSVHKAAKSFVSFFCDA